jgi:putative Holliday junction resolvase
MAIDVGFKKIGVAVSDPLLLTAYPFKILRRRTNRQTFEELARIVDEKDVKLVLVGLPLGGGGEETTMSRKIRKFVEKFDSFLRSTGRSVEFVFVDESYSTVEARSLCRELSRSGEVDDVSSALMLKEWLEKNHPRGSP